MQTRGASGAVEIPSLTGLRFYAAGLIVYTHIVATYWTTPGEWLTESYRIDRLGMTLFFVLSGFVIYYNYGESIATFRPGALRDFLAARIARLYPLYLFVLGLALTNYTPSPFTADRFGAVWPYFLTLTQAWLPMKVGDMLMGRAYIGIAWSISAEMFLYLVFIALARPLFMLRSTRHILIVAGLILIAATSFYLGHALGLWIDDPGPDWAFYFLPYYRIAEFMLGAMTAALFLRRRDRPPTLLECRIGMLVLAASLAWIVVLFAAFYIPRTRDMADTFQLSWGYAPAAAGLIYGLARFRTRLSWWVENKAAILLGDASYSIYMLHWVILWSFPHNIVSGGELVLRIVLTLMLIVLISLGMYQFFEVPTRRWVRALLSTRNYAKQTA